MNESILFTNKTKTKFYFWQMLSPFHTESKNEDVQHTYFSNKNNKNETNVMYI